AGAPRGKGVGPLLYAAEGFPYLVRDARRHLSERRQLLSLDQPPLRLDLVGEVAEHADRSHQLAMGVEDAAHREMRGKGLAPAGPAGVLAAPAGSLLHRQREARPT